MNNGLIVACGLWLGACASVSPHGSRATSEATAQALAPRSVAIFRSGGPRAQWSELVEAASQAEVVFVGENHGHPLGLASAAALFEDAMRLDPSRATARFNLAIARLQQGRRDDAVALLREALRIDPTYAQAAGALRELLGTQ